VLRDFADTSGITWFNGEPSVTCPAGSVEDAACEVAGRGAMDSAWSSAGFLGAGVAASAFFLMYSRVLAGVESGVAFCGGSVLAI